MLSEIEVQDVLLDVHFSSVAKRFSCHFLQKMELKKLGTRFLNAETTKNIEGNVSNNGISNFGFLKHYLLFHKQSDAHYLSFCSKSRTAHILKLRVCQFLQKEFFECLRLKIVFFFELLYLLIFFQYSRCSIALGRNFTSINLLF